MGRTKKIIDLKPNEPIYELDVVTFKKTDESRGSKKGQIGTVVDLFNRDKNAYEVVTQSGDVSTFAREDFRLATPEDIEKHKNSEAIKKANKIAPPKLPEEANETL